VTLHTYADVIPIALGISATIEVHSCCLLEHFSVLCSGCRSVGLEQAPTAYFCSTVGVRTKTFVIQRMFCLNHIQQIVADSGVVFLKICAIGGHTAMCDVTTSWEKNENPRRTKHDYTLM